MGVRIYRKSGTHAQVLSPNTPMHMEIERMKEVKDTAKEENKRRINMEKMAAGTKYRSST